MNGIIIVNKEKGFTSHDVVAKLRGILRFKKIGHTGTLDPDATGVLPVCVGKATRVCDLLTDKDKTYVAVVKLGVTTDTQDMTGQLLASADVSVTEDQLRVVLKEFTGEIDQIPPMYSAIATEASFPEAITIHLISVSTVCTSPSSRNTCEPPIDFA